MLRVDECIRFHDAFRLFTTAEGCGPGTGFAFCSAALGGRDGVGAPSKCFASTNASGSTTHSAALPRPKDVALEPASPSVARPSVAAIGDGPHPKCFASTNASGSTTHSAALS